jgi:hypothetical protein
LFLGLAALDHHALSSRSGDASREVTLVAERPVALSSGPNQGELDLEYSVAGSGARAVVDGEADRGSAAGIIRR